MAIVMNDGERLSLRVWEFNAARIITELANIVNNHGGRVKPTNTALISDRSAKEEADKKEWVFDCFFGSNCGQQDITEAANLIFNMLCNAPMSEIIRDKRKQRVPNTYNEGWHFETVYTPERLENVDF